MITLLSFLATLAYAGEVPADAPGPLNGVDSSLTLYVYPPVNPLNWSTPETTMRSTLNNLISLVLTRDHDVEFTNDFGEQGSVSTRYKSSIGHTLAHVRCTLANGEPFDHWASLSGQDFVEEDKRLLLKEKIGYGALFHNYIDGHIIVGQENVKRITWYKGGHGRKPRYLQFELDPSRCLAVKKMLQFFESFHFAPDTKFEQLQARAPEDLLYFTNQIDPYDSYLERMRTGHGLVGGGCAPFGAALLKITRHYRPIFDSLFRMPITVSEKLIGGWFDPRINAIRRVSIHDILGTPLGDHWTYENEGYANRTVSQYDPQKIWEFAGSLLTCLDGQACDDTAAHLVGGENGRLQPGDTQVFRDTIVRDMGSTMEHIRESAVQPVRGVVWRLR